MLDAESRLSTDVFPFTRELEVEALKGKKVCIVATGGSSAMVCAIGVMRDCENHFVVSFDHLSPLHDWTPPANDTPPGYAYIYCYHMDQSDVYGDVFLPTAE